MPIYEFQCNDCGLVEHTLPISRSQEDQACPYCSQAVARTIASAPQLGLSRGSATLRAGNVNERASNEPLRSNKDQAAAAMADRHSSKRHPAGCGCCGGGKSRTRTHADQSKSFPGSRPWMISH